MPSNSLTESHASLPNPFCLPDPLLVKDLPLLLGVVPSPLPPQSFVFLRYSYRRGGDSVGVIRGTYYPSASDIRKLKASTPQALEDGRRSIVARVRGRRKRYFFDISDTDLWVHWSIIRTLVRGMHALDERHPRNLNHPARVLTWNNTLLTEDLQVPASHPLSISCLDLLSLLPNSELSSQVLDYWGYWIQYLDSENRFLSSSHIKVLKIARQTWDAAAAREAMCEALGELSTSNAEKRSKFLFAASPAVASGVSWEPIAVNLVNGEVWEAHGKDGRMSDLATALTWGLSTVGFCFLWKPVGLQMGQFSEAKTSGISAILAIEKLLSKPSHNIRAGTGRHPDGVRQQLYDLIIENHIDCS